MMCDVIKQNESELDNIDLDIANNSSQFPKNVARCHGNGPICVFAIFSYFRAENRQNYPCKEWFVTRVFDVTSKM